MSKRWRQGMILLIAVMMLMGVAEWVQATPLPTRPTLPANETTGGTIKLTVNSTQVIADGTHTIVQWQDNTGEWQDVDGWRATFDHTREIVWWVAPEHLGQSNYRWIVFDSADNQLAISAEFSLPTATWQPLIILVDW